MIRRLALFLPVLCAALAPAQDKPAPNKPVDLLAPFRPMLGTWTGEGTVRFDPNAEPTGWTARATFQLCLGGQFVQEDIELRFAALPTPLAIRGYLGWDATRLRHVALVITSAGEVGLHKVVHLPDGSLLQVMNQEQMGVPYAERSLFKVDGDTMTHAVELLMAEGASIPMVRGTFKRQDADAAAYAVDPQTEPFLGMPAHDDIGRLCRMAGEYDVAGEVVMAPGQPRMKIQGRDRHAAWFGNGVLRAHTLGSAVGMPGEYESRAYWAYDKKAGCLRSVYVSSMGEIGEMESYWVGNQLISVQTGVMAGQPQAQRFVLEFDERGVALRGRGHTMYGALDPFESFVATYTKK